MFQQIDITQLDVVQDWRVEFGLWLKVNGRSELTVSAYLNDMKHFGEFWMKENGSEFLPNQLNATDVKKYFAEQDADKQTAPASRNRRLASLRVFVQWAVDAELLEYDPTISIKRLAVEPSPRDRSGSEMCKLNAVISGGSHLKRQTEKHLWLGLRDRIIWILFNSAGLRESEVVGLDVSDLNFAENKINVFGKGAKKATVDVSAKAMNEIAEWLRTRGVESNAVVTGWEGERITRGQVWRRIKMIGGAGIVNDLKPHDLRHTFAYEYNNALAKIGVPELARKNAVRKQLRHADERTTQLYFGVRDSQVRSALEVM